MSAAATVPQVDPTRDGLRRVAIVLLIATLAWAPFPLGGAIAWAAGLQATLIALCWTLWVFATSGTAMADSKGIRTVLGPLVLGLAALAWAVVQVLPGMPAAWVHPVWTMAADALERPVIGTISLNPWRSEAEIVNLTSYAMAAWLAFRMSREASAARLLQNSVLGIGAVYAIYAILLALMGYQQTDVFYALAHVTSGFSGSYVCRNSFATFMGLIVVAAVARVVADGSEQIVAGRGWRHLMTSVIDYGMGRGVPVLVVALLCLAAVMASASRAGSASTACGLAALAITGGIVARHGISRRWAGVAAAAIVVPLLALIALNGDALADRLGDLFDTGVTDETRFSLWDATSRMIADAPWLGLGLGTFQDAYPMYAVKVYPFVMDRAHNDWLEFAAGLGLPAAIAWWSAMVWLIGLCVRGLRTRRRHRIYCAVAIAASVLVAVHSCFDFSLQMPAVALLYAVLMGIGVAQSIPTRRHA
jgi:O-antigen ligase